MRVDTDDHALVKGMDTDDQRVRTQASANTKANTKDIYTEEFDEFWLSYPRKVNKFLAFQKYQKEVKNFKTEQDGKEELKAAARIYAMIMKDSKIEEIFIPHCATWLNQRRYLDYGEEKIKEEKNKMKSKNRLAG